MCRIDRLLWTQSANQPKFNYPNSIAFGGAEASLGLVPYLRCITSTLVEQKRTISIYLHIRYLYRTTRIYAYIRLSVVWHGIHECDIDLVALWYIIYSYVPLIHRMNIHFDYNFKLNLLSFLLFICDHLIYCSYVKDMEEIINGMWLRCFRFSIT